MFPDMVTATAVGGSYYTVVKYLSLKRLNTYLKVMEQNIKE